MTVPCGECPFRGYNITTPMEDQDRPRLLLLAHLSGWEYGIERREGLCRNHGFHGGDLGHMEKGNLGSENARVSVAGTSQEDLEGAVRSFMRSLRQLGDQAHPYGMDESGATVGPQEQRKGERITPMAGQRAVMDENPPHLDTTLPCS